MTVIVEPNDARLKNDGSPLSDAVRAPAPDPVGSRAIFSGLVPGP